MRANILNKIPAMSRQERQALRLNAERMLKRNPIAEDAREVLLALDELEPKARQPNPDPSFILVGPIAWEAHGHAEISNGYVNGRPVASIRKLQTHRHDNDDSIYIVEVLGERLTKRFRYIDEAREAAAAAFALRGGENEQLPVLVRSEACIQPP